ncbi:hypothetical protein FFLO_02653 [Filobasidium floriforme]|uniref:Myb/SANT-like domain-containing protein n=1 Tax=Filobasidium floriforme TaxID=5210 RepID=A0A8K0JMM8_9TREE|nr:hypothetical protein FFLO_02653 [Filobasidium floriforme]
MYPDVIASDSQRQGVSRHPGGGSRQPLARGTTSFDDMSIVEVISLENPPSMATEGFEVMQVDKGGPTSTVKTEGGRKNAQWSLADDRLMLELLTEEQRRGQRADNGFKRGTWASVAAEVNKIRSKGGEKDEKSAKFRFNKLKNEGWKPWNTLLKRYSQSGAGFDEEMNTLSLPDGAWDELKESGTKDNLALYALRGRSNELYSLLDDLVSKTTPDGRFAIDPFATDPSQTPGGTSKSSKAMGKRPKPESDDSSDESSGPEVQVTPSRRTPTKRQRTSVQADLIERLDRLDERMEDLAKRDPEKQMERVFKKLADVVTKLSLSDVDYNRLVNHFTDRPVRGIAFLATPDVLLANSVKRMMEMEQRREEDEEASRQPTRSTRANPRR